MNVAHSRSLNICLLLMSQVIFSGSAIADSFGAQPPATCSSMTRSLTTSRWLSLPQSRLVVNPTYDANFLYTPSSAGRFDAVLPMDLAYYARSIPVPLPGFWFVERADVSAEAKIMNDGPSQDAGLSQASASVWSSDKVNTSFGTDSATLTTTDQDFGSIVRTVTVDLDKTPDLTFQVPTNSSNWAFKVNDGSQPVDTWIHPSEHFGAQFADIRSATGWHGVRTFQIRLFEVGRGQSVTFSRAHFCAALAVPAPASDANVWSPDAIQASASVDSSTSAIESVVTLPDADTVAQSLHIQPGGTTSIVLSGQFDGTVHWDANRNALLFSGHAFSAILTVSRKSRWLGVRPNQLDWMRGDEVAEKTGSGIWRLELNGLKPGETIIVAARFAPSADVFPKLQGSLPRLADQATFNSSLQRNRSLWNAYLSRVPRPLDFTPRAVPSLGVTSADVRQSYYLAWVFFYQDTLPAIPQSRFPYPQACVGKPSLWANGATNTEPSDLWDSVVLMQSLALVQPQTIWSAARGMMSQLDSDGYVNGEALPSICARSFWLLYEQTGDRDQLRSLYPYLKRYLLWKCANPWWFFPNKTKPTSAPDGGKDQEYVVANIMDMDYAGKIAKTLGMTDEAAMWHGEQQTQLQNYHNWFIPVQGGPIYRVYYSGTKVEVSPNNTWCLEGLQIGLLLSEQDRAALLFLYKSTVDMSVPFLEPNATKFPLIQASTLGLFECGHPDLALQFADASLRDVTRAQEFSETYAQTNPPASTGVRPSAFGACLMENSVLWHNGVVLDEGLPVLIGMPGAVGVNNIQVRGEALDVHFHEAAHTVTLTGPALARLHIPQGFKTATSGGSASWFGTIAVGQTIALTDRSVVATGYL